MPSERRCHARARDRLEPPMLCRPTACNSDRISPIRRAVPDARFRMLPRRQPVSLGDARKVARTDVTHIQEIAPRVNITDLYQWRLQSSLYACDLTRERGDHELGGLPWSRMIERPEPYAAQSRGRPCSRSRDRRQPSLRCTHSSGPTACSRQLVFRRGTNCRRRRRSTRTASGNRAHDAGSPAPPATCHAG